MNSDYSSSTYHIYDQISDLIIIKQQRLERKRQQEHRRKVILVCLIATLLVSALLFLLLQSLYTTLNSSFNLIHKSSSQPVPTMIQNEQPLLSSSLSPFISSSQQQQQQQQQQNNNLFRRVSSDTATSNGVLLRPWQTAPSGGVKTNELFDINRFQLLAASSSPEQLNHRFNQQQQQQLPSAAEISQFDLARQWQQSQSWQPDQLQQQQQQFASRFQPQQPLQPQLILPDVIQRTSSGQQPTPVHQQQQHHHHHHFAASTNEAAAAAAAAASNHRQQQQPVVPNSIHQQHHNINNNNNPQLAVQPLEASPATSAAAAASNQPSAASHLPLPLSPPPPPPPPPKKPSVLRKQYACPNQCSGRGQCVKVSPSSQLEASQAQQQQLQEWRCQCQPGTTGDDCGYLLERQCDDGIDNDRDGLVDCADSECCSDKVCQNSTLCMKSPDPLDILNRKNPPPPTSSFFQRMQFLIEKFSSQIYSQPRDFNDSLLRLKYADRASVIRGKVTYMKQGVTGVRVSVAGQINLGITFTRDGGYFDLMVNGGGVLVIEFRREPFATLQKAVRVPWNEIVLMDSVELSLDSPNADLVMQPAVIMQQANEDSKSLPVTSGGGGVQKEHQQPSCLVHNYRIMRPYITAAPKSSPQRSQIRSLNQNTNKLSSSQAVILRDSGIVKQSFLIPKSSPSSISSDADQHQHHHQHLNQQDFDEQVSLVYISSKATDFMSTITLQLTPPLDESVFKLPTELKLIHLKIIIEGNLFEQLLEPSNNLSFTYAWNRRNVYRQKSFGLSTASVSVGYEYFDCKHIVWTTKHIQLPGYDLSISDIGSQWNLNIHHRYNHRDSILQRADGANFNLKTDKPRVVQPLMGDGYQRPANCPQCDNVGADSSGNQQLSEQRLLKPQALVSAPDGSLYVGDFNLIRRIEWSSAATSTIAPKTTNSERIVRTVLELPPSRVPSRYNLAMNYADQKLYLTDPDRQQIYLIRDHQGVLNKQSGNDTNVDDSMLVPVVGSGIKCQQLEDRAANCGDGQAAELARLIEPKAVAFDLSSRMYIADGPNVRMVDNDGKIYTILGDYGNLIRHTKFPCSGEAIPMHKFVPRSPVDLAFSPIDDTLHILDDNVVYKITQDKRVQIVAGRLSHCLNQNNAQQPQQPVNWPPRTGTGSSNRQQQQLRATEVFLQSAQSIAFAQNGDLFISEDDQKQVISRVLLVVPDEDTISLYAGLPVDDKSQIASSQLMPTVDSVNLEGTGDVNAQLTDNKQRIQQQQSNILPLAVNQVTVATDYKFNSVAAITVDQQGKLVIADKLQLRILSVEPDLPQINLAGEYELQSPDNSDELLIFNRHGHHIATREISSTNQQPPAAALTSSSSSSQLPVASQQQQQHHHHRYHHHPKQQQQRTQNKYTFSYNVNTSLGQLTSVSYANGNKLSIYRDGSQSNVKMIETTFGAQCKLDISRSGQLNSIAVTSASSPSTSNKTNFTYQSGTGGLLKQSVDVILGQQYEFNYDEFGRAVSISHSSSSNSASRTECRVSDSPTANLLRSTYLSQQCSTLIVAEA